jgi:hypothetical protein
MPNLSRRHLVTEYLDRVPAGWFVLDVMRKEPRKWDWAALVIDVDPDDLKNCACDFPALFYVHPKEYHPGEHKAQQRWVSVPGKHRNRDSAFDLLEEMTGEVEPEAVRS